MQIRGSVTSALGSWVVSARALVGTEDTFKLSSLWGILWRHLLQRCERDIRKLQGLVQGRKGLLELQTELREEGHLMGTRPWIRVAARPLRPHRREAGRTEYPIPSLFFFSDFLWVLPIGQTKPTPSQRAKKSTEAGLCRGAVQIEKAGECTGGGQMKDIKYTGSSHTSFLESQGHQPLSHFKK